MRLWAVVLVLVASASAQAPPCFRSKFAHEWPARVKRVELLDGNKLSARDKNAMVRELRHECDCWPCALTDEVSAQIRDMYQWYGYFQAVAEVDIRKHGIDAYDITARIQEGQQFRLAEITFGNVRAFPAERLRPLFALRAGDLYDTRKVREGFAALRQLYARHGYVDFSLVPDARVDAERGTIALRVDLEEGRVYRLGPLLLTGMEPGRGAGKRLLDAWKPHVGEIYNRDFVDEFVAQYLTGGESRPRIMYLQDAKAGTMAVRVEFAGK